MGFETNVISVYLLSNLFFSLIQVLRRKKQMSSSSVCEIVFDYFRLTIINFKTHVNMAGVDVIVIFITRENDSRMVICIKDLKSWYRFVYKVHD